MTICIYLFHQQPCMIRTCRLRFHNNVFFVCCLEEMWIQNPSVRVKILILQTPNHATPPTFLSTYPWHLNFKGRGRGHQETSLPEPSLASVANWESQQSTRHGFLGTPWSPARWRPGADMASLASQGSAMWRNHSTPADSKLGQSG